MDDRRMLELAAKANWRKEIADEEVLLRYDECEGGILYLHADNQDHNGCDREFLWNPLDDDGDAFRLQVKRRFTVKVADHECEVFDEVSGECLASIPMLNPTEDEVREVTCRAITMAAAAIASREAGKVE